MTRKENSIGYLKTFLLLLFVGLDYIAIILAEEAAFLMRNTFFHSSHLHISWLNFWLVFPCLYIFFINLGQLYSRRRPFYKEVEQLFQAVFYGTAAIVFVLYVARIVVHTSRFFVGAFGILAFIFLVLGRYFSKNYLQRRHLLQIPVIIIGAGKTAELLAKSMCDDPGIL